MDYMNTLQSTAFDKVVNGESIFITGIAGCGKTYLLSRIITWAQTNLKKISVTSSTGISAVLIGGSTLHSSMGFGLGKGDVDTLVNKVKYKNKRAYNRIRKIEILVIDEISMISSDFFDKVSEFMGMVREKPYLPFGGVQLVISGDFAQLPSVEGQKYCFQSSVWEAMDITTVNLVESMRQRDDEEFMEILRELRWGRMTKTILNRLRETKNKQFHGDILPTVLHSKNVDVDSINIQENEKLKKNGAESMVYKTRYSHNKKSSSWAKSGKITEFIELCMGSQVMLSINLDINHHLVNGSRGIVHELTPDGVWVMFMNGNNVLINFTKLKNEEEPDIWVEYIPLRLAWSITIHKSQGATISSLILNLGKEIFMFGQGFTALSRVRSLDDVQILDVKKNSFQCHPLVLKFYNET
jgi:ATP-dependent DNA helicase PIF1